MRERAIKPPPPSGRGRGLALWWALAFGVLAGRLSTLVATGVQPAIDLALAAAVGLRVAIAYRRWARQRLRAAAPGPARRGAGSKRRNHVASSSRRGGAGA